MTVISPGPINPGAIPLGDGYIWTTPKIGHVRRTLPFGLAICTAIVVGVELVAPYVLHVFGPAYAQNGSTALRLLILVGPSYVIKDHYVAIRRAQRRLTDAAPIMALGTLAEAASSVLGAAIGDMNGLCIGWAVAASCEALLLSPAVMKVFRKPPAVALGAAVGVSDPDVPGAVF